MPAQTIDLWTSGQSKIPTLSISIVMWFSHAFLRTKRISVEKTTTTNVNGNGQKHNQITIQNETEIVISLQNSHHTQQIDLQWPNNGTACLELNAF